MHAQVIKKWYAELPDKLGKVLAQQKASDHQKTSEEMEEEDDEQEEEYLKKEGWKEEDIEEAVPYDEDPVTVGTWSTKFSQNVWSNFAHVILWEGVAM